MASPILWQSEGGTTIVIDVPRSIEAAQGIYDVPFDRQILCSPPLQSPFPSNEPKSASARAKLDNNTIDAELHAEYLVVLQQALDNVKRNHTGEWCLPRLFTEVVPRVTKKRKLDVESNGIITGSHSDASKPKARLAQYPDDLVKGLAGDSGSQSFPNPGPVASPDASTADLRNDGMHSILNSTDEPALFRPVCIDTHACHQFHVPPKAYFYLGNCADTRSFHESVRGQAQRTNTRKHFDSILLDPPWPNRSVKRTHKTAGSTYVTSPSLPDIRDLLLDMKLNLLMDENCLVGMWITNKPAARELVLGDNGIFECWDVELVEEWVWLKTTVHGEPVTPLDALWRKPYEVLLLGQKRSKLKETSPEEQQPPTIIATVKRKTILSVPDLHSRKPCLKELIGRLMQDPRDYRALEVFARHLVAGWWSWGDECIKFNWEGFWRENSDTSTTPAVARGTGQSSV